VNGSTTHAELPVLVSAYYAPHSYTGEDSAEVQLPSNPTLIERLLGALTEFEGCRLANPGEFTARAYLNGKLTLDQAEGVAATVAATTTEQLEAARALLAGAAGAEYRAWADEVTTLLALVEAGIDFTDQEDVVAIAPAQLRSRVEKVQAQLAAHLGHAEGHEAGHAMPRVALVGRPNAGKSTLFNALLGRRRAVTSPVAGTTRDVLAEELDLCRDVPGAPVVLLEDLAGLDAGSQIHGLEAHATVAAHRAIEEADVLLWCDPSGRFDAAPLGVQNLGAAVIRVRTFGDQPRGGATREDLSVCALDGWNLGTLRRAIADAATSARAAGVAALLPRHRRAMQDAAGALADAAVSAPEAARLENPELTATALRSALDALSELVGQISPDDVLGRVFATFCVGK
jgi:tRNA modification GTPase